MEIAMTAAALPVPNADWALFLDFDGTLVEIADSPGAVQAERHLVDILSAVSDRLGGALAIVSGRPISEIDDHLDHARFAAAGLHGLEIRHRPGGPVSRPNNVSPVGGVRDSLKAFAARNAGILFEDKELAVALHYRNRPDLAAACLETVRTAVKKHESLQILEGKMVFEVKPATSNKGRAVKRFMAESPYAGRIPVFAGDDVTDEDGFEAARAFGGFGIKIGGGRTAAPRRIESVPQFLRWLEALPGRIADDGHAGAAEEVVNR
jgi:trehalose 6-phosphate phosphatase